ncbi:MAG: hypothetical protein NTX58_08500 [Actinobacteria bacterium]|nr:hypothetical protein [Actinomycetota bacterium]
MTTSGVIIVAGKGGVGKTAVSAALAMASSSVGLRTLIVEVEGKSGLASLFNSAQFSYSEIQLVEASLGVGEVRARTVLPEDALLDYLKDHGLKRISGRLVSTGALDVVATAVPGISDILVLGKIKQLERSGQFDLIIVDAPAAGHAITFLRSASGLEDAVKVGPINTQAKDVLALLNDPTRCRVLLVTSPEETPVNELIETAYSLEDEVGVSLGPVVVNSCSHQKPRISQMQHSSDCNELLCSEPSLIAWLRSFLWLSCSFRMCSHLNSAPMDWLNSPTACSQRFATYLIQVGADSDVT